MTASSSPPRLHVLVSGAELARREAVAAVTREGGAEVLIQLRAPALDGRRLFEAACWLVELGRATSTPVVVNDRLDVALAAGAAGGHLKEVSIDPASARAVIGDGALLGRSVHAVETADSLSGAPVDYLTLGAVFRTRSHPDRTPLAPEAWRAAAAVARRPVLGVGGVTPERVPGLLDAGLHGAVVYRGVWGAEHPHQAVSSYLQVLSGGNP